jgi:hypothetical protein
MYRACWIDQPAGPDYPKLAKHSITAPIFDGRWLAEKSNPLDYLKEVKAKAGGNPGIFLCAQGTDSLGAWPSYRDLTGKEWADWAYNMVQNKIAPGSSGTFPVVHLNPETDDVEWQLAMIKRWRQRSPRRTTVWTPIAHKAEIFQLAGKAIATLGIIVGPQCYVGNMERVESENEVQGWLRAGFPRTQIMPFLDGAELGHWWGEEVGAIVFSQVRLP